MKLAIFLAAIICAAVAFASGRGKTGRLLFLQCNSVSIKPALHIWQSSRSIDTKMVQAGLVPESYSQILPGEWKESLYWKQYVAGVPTWQEFELDSASFRPSDKGVFVLAHNHVTRIEIDFKATRPVELKPVIMDGIEIRDRIPYYSAKLIVNGKSAPVVGYPRLRCRFKMALDGFILQ